MLPRSFVLCGLWAFAQVGLEKLILRSHFLCHQDNSHVQLLSIHLFQKVMELVVKKGKKLLKTIVSQSLFPLLIRLHDENQCVAEVRTQGLLVSLWEGAQLPPALAARGLQPPSGLGTRTWVPCALVLPLALYCSAGCFPNTALCSPVPEEEGSRAAAEEGASIQVQ